MGLSRYDYSKAVPVVNKEESQPRRPRSEISATALARQGYAVAPLRPPPGTKMSNAANLPFHNFEPSPELLKSSPQTFGGKILKFLKLRKKPSSATTTHFLAMEPEHKPSMQTFHFQDLNTHSTQFPTPLVEDVRKRYNYDSEEHSDVSDTNTSASITSSSRNSNSSGQSFDSNRSSGTPRSSLLPNGQLSNTQIMANILMSILDEEGNTTSASEELGSSEDEHPASLNGPHESAWHQTHQVCADSPILRGRRTSKLDGPHESAWHEAYVDSPKARQGSASKPTSGRFILKAGASIIDGGRLTSPGPSRRFGKLDLSRIEVSKLR